MLPAGLDALRFKSSSLDVPEREFKTLQSQISDAQRFADCEPLRIRCRSCSTESAFDGIADNKVRPVPSLHASFVEHA